MIESMFTLAQYPVPPLALQVAAGPGHGPPLVLLHGVLRSWRDWAGVWPALVPRWQVLAVDHRGHGGSDRCPGRYFVRDYADDLARLVRHHLPEGVVLFGHSLGALVAAAVAADCPERVRAVVLEDPPAQGFLREVAGTPWHEVWSGMRELAGSSEPVTAVARRLADVRQSGVRLGDLRDAASLRFSARCLRDVDPNVFTPLLAGRWLDGFDVDATFAGVRCPALVLRGDERLGGMLGRGEAERLASRMADCLLIDVPGVGHLIHSQATEATLRLVLSFLESL
jgi:pimeloyl-ACP methyl ester carboxylesterase